MRTDFDIDKELIQLATQVDPEAKPIEKELQNAFLHEFSLVLDKTSNNQDYKKIRSFLESKLKRYAKWIRVDLFPSKNSHIQCCTNFNTVIKTKKGTLYGHPDGLLRPLFYTSHCLDRFKERIFPKQYKAISAEYLKVLHRRPTPVEVLDEVLCMMVPYLEIGLLASTDICLNAMLGILVLESYKDCYVAKTFLLPDAKTSATWYRVEETDWEKRGYESISRCSIKDLLHHWVEPKKPTFQWYVPKRRTK